MKKNTYIFLLLIVFISSCQQQEELPAGILKEDAMVKLMVDMEVAQATLKFDAASEGIKPNYTKSFKEVCDTNKITVEQLSENLDYYCAEPIKMRIIYDQVIVALSKNQGKINERYIQEKNNND